MSNIISSSLILWEKRGVLKAWFLASRPRTLSISFVPLFMGTALASNEVEHLNWSLFFSLVLSVPWIQVGMNLVNDALDLKKGREYVKDLKLQRMELLSPKQFLLGGYVCFALTLLFAIPLMLTGGWPFVCLLLISILLGYFYTGGPFPLSYKGISESFILIFYGWISTGAAYYLQTGHFCFASFLAGTQIGLLAIVPHAINNLRDYISDKLVNKKTLIVRFGPYFALWEITFCSLTPFILCLLWIGMNKIWMTILPFLVFPFIMYNLKSIWQVEFPSQLYNHFLARSAISQFLFGCFLALGYFL